MFEEIQLDAGGKWIDLVAPTNAEEGRVEQMLGIDIPTHAEIRRYEPSNRFYQEQDAIFLMAQVVVQGETQLPKTMSVAFILKEQSLVTVRYENSRAFDLFADEIRRAETAPSKATVLVGLVEALVDRTSELLEGAADAADDMATSVLPDGKQSGKRRTAAELEAVLTEIQRLHRRVAKVRESLVSLGRMIGYLLARSDRLDAEFRARARSTARDIVSVTDHATFVAQNIQFVLDTLLGLISVEQNAIVKFFSIVAVVLLPPTLIAAIYGMNFENMPELTLGWGYPAALTAMLASAVLPYLWCRRRGWL